MVAAARREVAKDKRMLLEQQLGPFRFNVLAIIMKCGTWYSPLTYKLEIGMRYKDIVYLVENPSEGIAGRI